jgi:hypothetical protein
MELDTVKEFISNYKNQIGIFVLLIIIIIIIIKYTSSDDDDNSNSLENIFTPTPTTLNRQEQHTSGENDEYPLLLRPIERSYSLCEKIYVNKCSCINLINDGRIYDNPKHYGCNLNLDRIIDRYDILSGTDTSKEVSYYDKLLQAVIPETVESFADLGGFQRSRKDPVFRPSYYVDFPDNEYNHFYEHLNDIYSLSDDNDCDFLKRKFIEQQFRGNTNIDEFWNDIDLYNEKIKYKIDYGPGTARLYARDISIQMLKNSNKKLILHDLYYDFDIKRCWPTILKYLVIALNLNQNLVDDIDNAINDTITGQIRDLYYIDYKLAKRLQNGSIFGLVYENFETRILKLTQFQVSQIRQNPLFINVYQKIQNLKNAVEEIKNKLFSIKHLFNFERYSMEVEDYMNLGYFTSNSFYESLISRNINDVSNDIWQNTFDSLSHNAISSMKYNSSNDKRALLVYVLMVHESHLLHEMITVLRERGLINDGNCDQQRAVILMLDGLMLEKNDDDDLNFMEDIRTEMETAINNKMRVVNFKIIAKNII